MIEKTAEIIEQDSTCAFHKSQPLVAYDTASKKFACAQCLYEGDFENPEFVTLKAREITDAYFANYKEFNEVQQLLEDVQPQAITQSIRIQVSNFFNKLKHMLDDVEMEVMSKIKASKNLHSYLEITEQLASEVSQEMVEMVEDEKSKLDEKLSQNKFAYMILKNKHYDNLDLKFKKFNQDTRQNVAKVRELEQHIVAMATEKESALLKALQRSVEQFIQVDGQDVKLSNEIKLASVCDYIIKDSKVYRVDLEHKKISEFAEIAGRHYTKLVHTGESLLAIGGQSKPLTQKNFTIQREVTQIDAA